MAIELDPRKPNDRWASCRTREQFGARQRMDPDRLERYLKRVNAYITELEQERKNHWKQASLTVVGVESVDLDALESLLNDPHVYPAPWSAQETTVSAAEIPEAAKIPVPINPSDPVEIGRLWELYERRAVVADFYGLGKYKLANVRLLAALRNHAKRLIYLARIGLELLRDGG